MEEKALFDRITFKGKLEELSNAICKDYNLGNFLSYKLILLGYEDFNYILETQKGKFFVKVFAKFRNNEDCLRYVEVMKETIKSGISTPKLYKSKQGYLYKYQKGKISQMLCVMEFIEGDNFYHIKYLPNKGEIKYLAGQVAIINSIKIKPSFVFDEWAITSFPKMFIKKGKYLNDKDLALIQPLVKAFKELKIDKLPHAFSHGDIISTNVMKDKNNKIWIVDFAVSNYYPRIQELAVLTCNLLYRINDKNQSEDNLKIALKEYQKSIKLTNEELKALPTYIKLAHAMHVLSANYQKEYYKNTTSENEYWLEQGRTGLRMMK